MRYWWVNQNQTYRQEIKGGYLWSPKRNANGARNPFYETMREVSPGDLVFSFVDTVIAAIGVAQCVLLGVPETRRVSAPQVNIGRTSAGRCAWDSRPLCIAFAPRITLRSSGPCSQPATGPYRRMATASRAST